MTLSLTINETLKWLSSLPILMQKSFWWWQCSDRYIISLSSYLHTPFPPFSPSLISLMVSVDVKHHVYLLTDLVMPWVCSAANHWDSFVLVSIFFFFFFFFFSYFVVVCFLFPLFFCSTKCPANKMIETESNRGIRVVGHSSASANHRLVINIPFDDWPTSSVRAA